MNTNDHSGFEPPGAADPRHPLPTGPGHGRRGPDRVAGTAELLGSPRTPQDSRRKGHVRHDQDGPRYVYLPTVARDNAQRSALRHILQTFFDGSAEQAISALLDDPSSQILTAELDRLARMIDTARKSGA